MWGWGEGRITNLFITSDFNIKRYTISMSYLGVCYIHASSVQSMFDLGHIVNLQYIVTSKLKKTNNTNIHKYK